MKAAYLPDSQPEAATGNRAAFRFLVPGALKVRELTYPTPIEILRLQVLGLRGPDNAMILGRGGRPVRQKLWRCTGKVITWGRLLRLLILEADKALPDGRPFDLLLTTPMPHRNMWVFEVGWRASPDIRRAPVSRGMDRARGLWVLERRLAGRHAWRLDFGGPFPGPPERLRAAAGVAWGRTNLDEYVTTAAGRAPEPLSPPGPAASPSEVSAPTDAGAAAAPDPDPSSEQTP